MEVTNDWRNLEVNIKIILMKKSYFFVLAGLLSTAFSFGQVQRVSMIETFTSSTCPPCAPANTSLEALLAQPANDDKFVSLKYQVNWPGNGDPYYTGETGVRRGYYGVSSVPNGFVDGGYDGNPGSLTQGLLDGFYAVPANVDLVAYYQIDEATQKVDVQVDFEALDALPLQMRLYVAIFEYETVNNIGGNGETKFEHVMKKMLNSASGNFLGSFAANETAHEEYTYTFNGNYTLPSSALDEVNHATEHTVEEFSDLGVAVWLQNINTKEVYQATYGIMGFNPLAIDENESTLASAKIYPNPTSEDAAIAFHSTDAQPVTVQVINTLGAVVHSSEVNDIEIGRNVYELSTKGFANGIYSVRVSSSNGWVSKKFSIQK